jgi:hypothetical protein
VTFGAMDIAQREEFAKAKEEIQDRATLIANTEKMVNYLAIIAGDVHPNGEE